MNLTRALLAAIALPLAACTPGDGSLSRPEALEHLHAANQKYEEGHIYEAYQEYLEVYTKIDADPELKEEALKGSRHMEATAGVVRHVVEKELAHYYSTHHAYPESLSAISPSLPPFAQRGLSVVDYQFISPTNVHLYSRIRP